MSAKPPSVPKPPATAAGAAGAGLAGIPGLPPGFDLGQGAELLGKVLGDNGPSSSNSDAGASPTRFNSFNSCFKIIYTLICTILIILLFVIVFVSLIDILYYWTKDIVQYYNRKIDKTIYIRDTNEYKIYDYAKSKASDSSEPQNIYLNISFVKVLLKIAGIFVIVFALHISLFLMLMLWSKLRGFQFIDDLVIPFEILLPIALVIIAAFVLNALYTFSFKKTNIDNMMKYKNYMNETKDYMYSTMSNDIELLKTITKGNNDDIINKLANMINDNEFLSSTSTISPYKNVASGIVTYSLLTYYQKHIPEVDIDYESMMKIFTYEQISKKLINPIDFFIYKKPPHIANIWGIIRDDIKEILEDPEGFNNTKFFDSDREDKLRNDIDKYILGINTKLTKLHYIHKSKKDVFSYMVGYFILSLLFLILVIIAGIVYGPGKEFLTKFIDKYFNFNKTESESTKTKPTETESAEIEPPTETKSTETKSTETKSTETKPPEMKPTEMKPTETKPTEMKST